MSKMRWDKERDRKNLSRHGYVSIEQEKEKMTEYRVKGAFFENPKDVGPAFTGFVEIDGVKTSIALWPKRSAKGDNYLQVSEDKKRDKTAAPAPARTPFQPRMPLPKPSQGNDPVGELPRRNSDMDDDIPF